MDITRSAATDGVSTAANGHSAASGSGGNASVHSDDVENKESKEVSLGATLHANGNAEGKVVSSASVVCLLLCRLYSAISPRSICYFYYL